MVANIQILGINNLFADFVNVVLETMIISFVLLLIECSWCCQRTTASKTI